MPQLLIRRAEVEGRVVDLRIADGRIAELGPELGPRSGETRLDAAGGALLPGLHDHHIHLLALAAARGSVGCGPPRVRDRDGLRAALAAAEPVDGWIRGVGYHESVAGELDARQLDALAPARVPGHAPAGASARPVRVQHRSGALWMLNSAALERVAARGPLDHPGVERDAQGRPNGRLFRADAWLRARLPTRPPPSLASVSCELASYGVVGVTDATPDNGPDALAHFARARREGELLQRIRVMGGHDLPATAPGDDPDCTPGACKRILDERALPELGAFAAEIERAHAAGRRVAVHCVTRAELLFALAAFEMAGCDPGDRIEHAAVSPPEALRSLARLGLIVATQPHFIAERGDDYRREVDPIDLPCLYRGAGFDAAGVALCAGSDAPYGSADPWAAMRAAVSRRTRDGHVLGAAEALTPERALALFTAPADLPGGPPPGLRPGVAADLCLLEQPWQRVRGELDARAVAAVWKDGVRIA